MTGLHVGITGATGLVGEQLLRVLEERRFPVAELRPMASTRSLGTERAFGGRTWRVVGAAAQQCAGLDLLFHAAAAELSRSLAPDAVRAGATVVDLSEAWRTADGVPLVVPALNAATIPREPAILASPNCTNVGLALALDALHRAGGLAGVHITTFQAASGSGRRGLRELRAQAEARRTGAQVPAAQAFGARLDDNVVPQCDAFEDDGFTREEHRLRDEMRKILDLPALALSATCVRVPVEVGHAASVLVETERDLSVEAARAALDEADGVRVVDVDGRPSAAASAGALASAAASAATSTDAPYPTPADVAGTDQVLVGRIRRDPDHPRRLWLWQVADNLRAGAATNAVQIAEAWLARRF